MVYSILAYGSAMLKRKAKTVECPSAELGTFVDSMFETMYAAPGIGLAATQVNVHKQLIVIDVSENKDCPLVFINPAIEIIDHELTEYDEGCLSVPGFYEAVSRPRLVRIKALDRDGKPFTLEADGLLATCIQHEIDHLKGKLFVDYLSTLKRERIRSKLEKTHKESV